MAVVAHAGAFSAQFAPGSKMVGQHVWLHPDHGLVSGTYPTPEVRFDFGEEKLLSLESKAAVIEKIKISHLAQARRIVRRYELETESEIHTFGSATQLLVEGLNLIENIAPGTLDKLAEHKGRSKRVVAKKHEDLYNIPRPLSFSQKLKSGLFVATNNKDAEARGFLRQAAELADLEWGKDFTVRRHI